MACFYPQLEWYALVRRLGNYNRQTRKKVIFFVLIVTTASCVLFSHEGNFSDTGNFVRVRRSGSLVAVSVNNLDARDKYVAKLLLFFYPLCILMTSVSGLRTEIGRKNIFPLLQN